MGRVNDSLFVLREAVDAERLERVSIKSSAWEVADETDSSGNRRGFVSSLLPPRLERRLSWRVPDGRFGPGIAPSRLRC